MPVCNITNADSKLLSIILNCNISNFLVNCMKSYDWIICAINCWCMRSKTPFHHIAAQFPKCAQLE